MPRHGMISSFESDPVVFPDNGEGNNFFCFRVDNFSSLELFKSRSKALGALSIVHDNIFPWVAGWMPVCWLVMIMLNEIIMKPVAMHRQVIVLFWSSRFASSLLGSHLCFLLLLSVVVCSRCFIGGGGCKRWNQGIRKRVRQGTSRQMQDSQKERERDSQSINPWHNTSLQTARETANSSIHGTTHHSPNPPTIGRWLGLLAGWGAGAGAASSSDS